jgi:DNA-binding transcriptional LysR family regulator
VNVELRHLRSFVVLAEELNFTRAAARLHLAQQALSAQMKQLEQRLGAQLFARTTRSVELTPGGRALMERVPALLAGLDDALDAARSAARGETGHLTVGLLAAAPLDLTPRVLREFSRRRPAAAVTVRNVPFTDPSGGVRSGETDVAIVWLPFATDGLEVEVLLEEARVAVLPADHPLAAQTEVRAADLAAEPFGWIDDLDPVARDYWTLAEHRDGPARIGAHITGFDDYFAAVRSGQAVAASPASITRTLSWPDIALRPIPDAAPARLAVCRRAGDPNPLVTIFSRVAQELAATA